jgi:hypothetical protein
MWRRVKLRRITSESVKFTIILIILLIPFVVYFWPMHNGASLRIAVQSFSWKLISEHSSGARNLCATLSSLLYHLSGSWFLMSTTLTSVGLIPKNQWSDVS